MTSQPLFRCIELYEMREQESFGEARARIALERSRRAEAWNRALRIKRAKFVVFVACFSLVAIAALIVAVWPEVMP